MAHRINAINDEIHKCMSQLQSMGPSPTLLGGKAPNIQVTRNPFEIEFCGRVIAIERHPSLLVGALGAAVKGTTDDESWGKLFLKILEFPAFKDWCHNFDPAFFVDAIMTKIVILSAQLFGPRIGFLEFSTDLKFKAEYCTAYKKRALAAGTKDPKDPDIPSIVFMRGAAVTILVIITSDSGMRYSILVVQPRAAIGKFNMVELPAGMMDDSENFGGTAAKELKEETGLTINAYDLEDLTEDMGYDKAYPSCGACDEYMKFYLYRCKMSKKKLESLQSKCTGAYEEGENIKLKIVPFDRLAEHSPDMKTLTALYLYEQRCKRRATMYASYGGGRIIGQSIPDEAKIKEIEDDT